MHFFFANRALLEMLCRCRPWLNHTEAVKRGIAMSARLAEIKVDYELNDLDFATVVEAVDDSLPVC